MRASSAAVDARRQPRKNIISLQKTEAESANSLIASFDCNYEKYFTDAAVAQPQAREQHLAEHSVEEHETERRLKY
jgi:hypothetical protein